MRDSPRAAAVIGRFGFGAFEVWLFDCFAESMRGGVWRGPEAFMWMFSINNDDILIKKFTKKNCTHRRLKSAKLHDSYSINPIFH